MPDAPPSVVDNSESSEEAVPPPAAMLARRRGGVSLTDPNSTAMPELTLEQLKELASRQLE
ncbi:hypothetical protein HDU77_000051 [Chytriomyces hyalinus]|nr:hypothetical protein HDU77_000051 [Chytriomyces hyalinus]